MKRRKIVFLIFLFLLVVGPVSCTMFLFYPNVTTYYGNDTNDYLIYDWHLYDGGTPYDVGGFFPEDLNSVSEIIDYYYRAEFPAGFVGTYWELVLHVKYNDESYEQEIQRLNDYIVNKHSKLSEYGLNNDISIDAITSNLFNYEAIIDTYEVSEGTFGDTRCLYIYAILDSKSDEIVYVYLKSPIGNKHNPYLDSKYLPVNYFKNEKKKSADYYYFSEYHYILD